MRSLAITASFAAAIVIANVGGASAYPITPIQPGSGNYGGSSPTGDGVLPTPLETDKNPIFAENGIDYFGFYIPFQSSYTITAFVGATATRLDKVKINSFMLYTSQADLLPGAALSGVTYEQSIPNKYFVIDPITLAKGLYYLGVGATGTNPGTAPSGYAGTLTSVVSPVPLPASAPMFGAAVLALGLVGYGVKRKKAAASA